MRERCHECITKRLLAATVAVSILLLTGMPASAAPLAGAPLPVAAATPPGPLPAATPTAAPVTPVTPVTSRQLEVPVFYQAYTLSCEEAALRMALAYEGIAVTDAEVLAIIGIDWSAAYYDGSGLRWGDPYTAFVGNPDGSEVAMTGYGTYYPSIARAAAALGGTVLRSGEGISPADLYTAVLDGHPVVAWVTYQWVSAQRSDYVALDGRTIPYAGPVEHAITVVGVTAGTVTVNDPDFGRYTVSKSVFESSYATYNQMAVVIG
jgi:uncharacterized protein YvpB